MLSFQHQTWYLLEALPHGQSVRYPVHGEYLSDLWHFFHLEIWLMKDTINNISTSFYRRYCTYGSWLFSWLTHQKCTTVILMEDRRLEFYSWVLKDVCSMAFNVRMVQAAGIWALGPDSPCFAQKCYKLKTFPLIYSYFLQLKIDNGQLRWVLK